MIINNSYGPLLHSLPLTLADKSYGMPKHTSSRESVKIGENKDGYGGTPEANADSKPTPAPADSSSEEDDADAEKRANRQRRSMAGKQAVKKDFGKSVPMEGKRNEEPTDFYHPASVEPMRIIWLPKDTLGFAEGEVAGCKMEGVEASCDHAKMDAKGHVDIDGHPPGMLENDE